MGLAKYASGKGSPTTSPSSAATAGDAQSLLARLSHRASSVTASSSFGRQRSSSASQSSLLSYESGATTPGVASSSSAASSYAASEYDDYVEPGEPPRGYIGQGTKWPTSSAVLATRKRPNRLYDVDFTPDPSDPYSLRNSEFGYDVDPAHRTVSQYTPGTSLQAVDEEPALWVYICTYISYAMLICVGHLRDFILKHFSPSSYSHLRPYNGYAPLFSDFDSFYTRNLKARIDDCFARPITANSGRTSVLIDRTTQDYNDTFIFTGETTQALNVSSYNYLGFSQSRGACADQAEEVVRKYGVSLGSQRANVGGSELHLQGERLMAAFLGVEDAMIVSTGFATNSTTLPALLSKGCLVISDELNHSSIRFGARLSGAMVRQYKHNDMDDLESLLRECISQGQPRTHRPWRKILVIVEGLYSMEGTICDLPRILELKDIYKFYLYIDEAHSIGAMGPNGRGVCDYFGVDPRRVDVLMGTFTKSFGAAGGYIAGTHALISTLRLSSHAQNYAESMSPPVMSQIITSTASIMGPSSIEFVPSLASLPAHVIDGKEGRDRLRRLAFNCRYLSGGLKKLGFIVYGNRDSPIIPVLIYNPGKMAQFSRLMLQRHRIIVVIVGYPATPLVSSRVRFCLSAAHTKEDLDKILIAADDVGSILGMKLSPSNLRMKVEDVIKEGVEMVRASEQEGAASA